MIQRGQHFRLALETNHALRVAGKGLRQHLHRNLAFQLGVFGPINLPHATRAKGRENLIRTQASARRQVHRR